MPALYEQASASLARLQRFASRINRTIPAAQPAARVWLGDDRISPAALHDRSLATGILDAWTPLGPGNIGGRTRVVRFHPTTPTTLFAAGVSGGIWRSVDDGGVVAADRRRPDQPERQHPGDRSAAPRRDVRRHRRGLLPRRDSRHRPAAARRRRVRDEQRRTELAPARVDIDARTSTGSTISSSASTIRAASTRRRAPACGDRRMPASRGRACSPSTSAAAASISRCGPIAPKTCCSRRAARTNRRRSIASRAPPTPPASKSSCRKNTRAAPRWRSRRRTPT